jgi:hypothetical protein
MVGESVSPFEGTSRFQLLRLLGAGGMGVVYAARDRDTGTTVALKTLKNLDPVSIDRFKTEFLALAELSHPNLVRLGALFSEGQHWFFTMELVEGQDLLSYVRVDGAACDEGRLRSSLRQLALGVSALHATGKVHRDIKPSNVLVTPEGRVVLLDFGLITDAANQGGSETGLAGTPRYMAPEQAAEFAVGTAADWYSVGVVLYEALVGRAPFLGTQYELLMNKNKYEPPAPRVLCDGVPEDLDELCTRLLKMDPKARPRGREVLARLGVDDRAAHPGTISTALSLSAGAVFTGRVAEQEILARALADSQTVTTCVLIEGESGIGKSGLLRHFAASIEDQDKDALLLVGRCYERESVPYQAFAGMVNVLGARLAAMNGTEVTSLLTPGISALARLFPALRRAEAIRSLPDLSLPDPQEMRSRAFLSLRELLSRLSTTRRLIILIDDFQWIDQDSLTLLGDLLHPPDAPPLLFLAAVQTPTASQDPPMAAIERRLGTIRSIALGPLSQEESRTLAETLAGNGADDPQAARIAQVAQGHPLFLLSLSRHQGELVASEPSTLDELLWSKIQGIEGKARELLEVLAVAGLPLSHRTAAFAADLEPAAFAKAISLLRVVCLIRSSDAYSSDSLDTYHDRIRRVVLEHLDGELRARHHGRLANALSVSGEAPLSLARQLAAARDGERAAKSAEHAASVCSQALAFGTSASMYRLALELGRYDAPRRRALTRRLAEELANAGLGAEAADAYLAATSGANPTEALELRCRALAQHLKCGQGEDALSLLREVMGSVGLRIPDSSRKVMLSLLWGSARLRLQGFRWKPRTETEIPASTLAGIDACWVAAQGLVLADYVRGAELATRHASLALQAGEPTRVALSLAVQAIASSSMGGKSRLAAKLFAEAAAIASTVDDPYLGSLLTYGVAMRSVLAGRWRQAVAEVDHAHGLFTDRCSGLVWELGMVRLITVQALFYLGAIDELARRVPKYLREAEEKGNLLEATLMRTTDPNLAWLVRDDPAGARDATQSACRGFSRHAALVQDFFDLLAQGRIDLYEGDGACAWRHINDRWPALRRSLLLHIQQTRVFALNLRACAALAAARAGHESVLTLAARDAGRIEQLKLPYTTALAALLRAGVAAGHGHHDGAATLYDKAAHLCDDADMAMHAAVARLRQGELVGGDEGGVLVEGAHTFLRHQTIKDPSRWANMIAPRLTRPA